MRKTSWKAAPLCCDLNVYQLCWSHEIWLTRSLPLTCCATHSIAVSLYIVWHFPDGRVRLTIVASFRVATRDLAMWQRWQCGNAAMLPPTTSLGAKSNGSPRFSQVGQRLESHKWQLACCMQATKRGSKYN